MAPNPLTEPGDRFSRAHMEALFKSSNDAIITKALDGTVTSWNPAAERIFGYSASEMIGENILKIIPPDRRWEEAPLLGKVSAGESVESFETVRIRKDGLRVDVSVMLSPIRDDTGAIIGASKVARDISEKKRSEERLLATVRELQDIKAALDEHSIVAITDAAGRITYVNDKFCTISKYSREELIGRDHRLINSGYHPKSFFKHLWETIGRGTTWRGEILNRAKDGDTYWVDTTIYPRMGDSGKPTQFVAIRTDITQRKSAEAKLQDYAKDLAEKNKELETIVYTVSHDLRSPLVNVQGFGKQLARACEKIQAAVSSTPEPVVPKDALRQPLEVTIPQALRFINAGVTKMDTLLAGLLRYSRLGREALKFEVLDVSHLVSDALSAIKFQIDAAKVDVRVGILPDCFADRVQTSQVFANLFDNALKYRHPDRPLKLVVEGFQNEGVSTYSVCDNGIGIAPEHQAKAFEIFHRLDPNGPPGEGLGLTISQRVLERQKGRIWVESNPEFGVTFFVSLPSSKPIELSVQ